MTDLTAWLLAQVAHDEATALAATPGPWIANDASEWLTTTPTWEVVYTASDDDPFVPGETVALANYIDTEDAAHIAANDPAATLRRCAALRAVVELHIDGWHGGYPSACVTCVGQRWPCPTLTAVAGMYAGRDGHAAVVCGG